MFGVMLISISTRKVQMKFVSVLMTAIINVLVRKPDGYAKLAHEDMLYAKWR